MKVVDVQEIVSQYLKEHGFDGLYNDMTGCGCLAGELFPCGSEGVEECLPGYKTKCPGDDCDWGGECDWHISAGKDKPERQPNKGETDGS